MIRTVAATLAAGMLGVPTPQPIRLELAYLADAGYAAAVKLRCDPPGGAHPARALACRQLDAVDGHASRLKPAHTMCPMIYDPITATVTGSWRGRTVRWSHRYGNSCEMTRATGALFRF